MKVAREKHSAVLASNAVHHRVDSLTALAALVSIAASNIFPSLVALDAVAALVISGMVIRAGTTNVWTSLAELADQAIASDSQKDKVRQAASDAIASLLQAHGESGKFEVSTITGVKSGQNYIWEIRIITPDEATVLQLGEWEEEIRNKVAEKVSGTRMVKFKWIAQGAPNSTVTEWISENPDRVSASAETHAHEHDHSNGHSHEEEVKDKKQN
jgi:divalent metal cation (Fe/Co/Zn/Cd) transporter